MVVFVYPAEELQLITTLSSHVYVQTVSKSLISLRMAPY